MKSPNKSGYSEPTLIGGASRSGKTLLTLALQESRGPVAGFPLEGVFHVYHRRIFPFFETQRQRIVHEYLNRPRYVTGDRLQKASPKDYMGQAADELTKTMPPSVTHQISLLGWILDQFSENQKCSSWAAFDLHPEFFYKTYRKFIPRLRLAIMHRDPYAAIAAGVFWRSWPKAPTDRRNRFRLMLALWHLSKVVSDSLIQRYPRSVSRFSFNLLCNGDSREYIRLTNFFPVRADEIRQFFNLKPHFYFNPERGFLTPERTWEKLLTVREIEEINAVENGIVSDPFTRSLLTFGPHAPELTRQILDAYLYPSKTARRQFNSIRQLIIDARAGVQLRLHR